MAFDFDNERTYNVCMPDYDNCIANLPNSVLKAFGISEGAKTLKLLDSYLEKDYENIVVILLDGMGKCIIDENLDKNGFFNSNLAGTYSSIFPPTTVAATTSVLSGTQPCEHGWLGWDCYYPQVDKNVTVFLNTEMGTDKPAADYNIAPRYYGYENVLAKLKKGGFQAYAATPFAEPYPQIFPEICDRVEELCHKEGKKYIYAYWSEPDHMMHGKGCYASSSRKLVRDLEQQVKELCDKLENTIVIVTADHGHMDSKCVALSDYPMLTQCLVRLPSIEPRALNFFVKEDKKAQFVREFKREFADKFLLWTKEEVLSSKIFGPGVQHKDFEAMIGDYLAIAVSDLSIFCTRLEAESFIGAHAGLTEDEMRIPLIVIEK